MLIWVPKGTRGRLGEHRASGKLQVVHRVGLSGEGGDTGRVVQGWILVALPEPCPGAWTLYHVKALGSRGRLLGKGNNMIRFTF